jgi:hypothetical protein
MVYVNLNIQVICNEQTLHKAETYLHSVSMVATINIVILGWHLRCREDSEINLLALNQPVDSLDLKLWFHLYLSILVSRCIPTSNLTDLVWPPAYQETCWS